MTDYSEAEMLVIKKAFPSTTHYLCDFHIEQSWERWVRNHNNQISPDDQDTLLDLLRSCAWAPPAESDLPVDDTINVQYGI